jgi:hypothetical protein
MINLSRRVLPFNPGVPAAALFSFTDSFSGDAIGAPVGALRAVLLPLLVGTVFAEGRGAKRRRVGAARCFRT